MTRLLADLLPALPHFELSAPIDGVVVIAVTADSRLVKTGSLFVAVRGATVDGHAFIPQAVERGAAAVVGTADPVSMGLGPLHVPYVRVVDTRQALAWLAAAFHDYPSRQLRLIGVTGTDGKTTTSKLVYRILMAAGLRPGMISTLGASIAGQELDTGFHVTTPDAPDVQSYLADMRDAHCEAAVLEATSHGLHQGRVDACDFDVAVVTNVTHEHLDYHGSWEAYLDAKAGLFRRLASSASKPGQPKVAVLNADDASFEYLRAIAADLHLSYGLEASSSDLRAEDIEYGPDRTRFRVRTPYGTVPMETQLVGPFNIYNCLAATGAGLALGLSPDAIAAGIQGLSGVDGRMERVDRGQPFLALVDFAHTPVSLARALLAVRPMAKGRIIAVFGSAGLRDVHKRYLMAETSCRLADFTIFTAEDPRTESLEGILGQMAEGAREAGGREGRDFLVVADRVKAILLAVEAAEPGDVVIVCGKGHERSMCFGTREHSWSDQVVLAWALDQRLGSVPAPPPYRLPTST